jgi:hypothetical protein
MPEEWDAPCKAKYGHTRPYNTRPNKDGPNGLPTRGMIHSKAFCEALKDDAKAGIVLARANVVGLDTGQHHVLHFAPRAGKHVGSLYYTGKGYGHQTSRRLHAQLGKAVAAVRTPEDQARLAAGEQLTEYLRQSQGGVGNAVPDEFFFAAARPADYSFTTELEKATREQVDKFAHAVCSELREYYDKLGRFENIVIVAGKEFSSVGRGQIVANRKRILEILSDHVLVVVYNENYSSQLHYKCGRPLEQYRRHEVRTKICYCCTLEREDGRPELVNRDFNAAVCLTDFLCYELHCHQRPPAACGPKRVVAPIQGDEVSR